MSTPFPLEEDSQFANRPTFDPSSAPKSPGWSAGLTGFDQDNFPKAFTLLDNAVQSGVAKGMGVLGGILRSTAGTDFAQAAPDESIQDTINRHTADNGVSRLGSFLEQRTREEIKRTTPDAATVGAAGQILHSLVSAGTEMVAGSMMGGPLAAGATVGAGEGKARYDELIEAGVDPATAAKTAGITGTAAGLGAFMPGGFGSSLVSRVVTGAGANTVFGMANRYADHKVLDDAGYTAMAEQQKVIDSTQIITDLVLGAGFGGLAHLHAPAEAQAIAKAPGAEDAAMVVAAANRDRQAAPGIPTDPGAANAHADALESAVESLMTRRPVDVAESHVSDHDFLERPVNPEGETIVRANAEQFGGEKELEAAMTPKEETANLVARPSGFIDTRGGSEQFHGSPTALGDLRNDFYSTMNIYGQGFYTTDSAKIAESYTQKGLTAAKREGTANPSMYTAEAQPGVKLFDLASPVPDSVKEMLSGEKQYGADELAADLLHDDPSMSLRKLYDEVRAESRSEGYSADSVQDFFDGVRYNLEKEGYRGFQHLGGKIIGDEDHNVKIYWSPADDLKVKKADLSKYADLVPPRQAASPGKVINEPKQEGKAESTRPPPKEGEEPAERAMNGHVANILAEKPDLTILDEDGNKVKASDALAAANEDLATTTRESKIAAKTAIECYMRRGN